jgi:hypothetical protein
MLRQRISGRHSAAFRPMKAGGYQIGIIELRGRRKYRQSESRKGPPRFQPRPAAAGI